MKKMIASLLSVTLCLCFVGCNKKAEKQEVSSYSVPSGHSHIVASKTDSASQNSTISQNTTVSQNNSSAQGNSSVNSSSANQSVSQNSPASSKNPTQSASSKNESVYKDPIPANAPRIICWGDSITQGISTKGISYPYFLQKKLKNNYRVLNAGASGEKSGIIAARQGAYRVTLKSDITFKADYGSVILDDSNGFILEDGTTIEFSMDYAGYLNDLSCKNIFINGKEFQLRFMGDHMELLRDDYSKKLTLKKGSEVIFESSQKQKGSYCEIFYVSANDKGHCEGDAEDVEYLIKRYKAMINRHGDNNYMVIIPHWVSGYTEALKKEFGDRAVDLSGEMCKRVIENKEYPYTATDLAQAESGKIPDSLRNQSYDMLHLNSLGYEMMADVIYNTGVKLGFWK